MIIFFRADKAEAVPASLCERFVTVPKSRDMEKDGFLTEHYRTTNELEFDKGTFGAIL